MKTASEKISPATESCRLETANHRLSRQSKLVIGRGLLFFGSAVMISSGVELGAQYHDSQTIETEDEPQEFPDDETAKALVAGFIGYAALLNGAVMSRVNSKKHENHQD